MSSFLLQAKNISKHFNDRVIFSDLDLHLKSGTSVSILGPSGSGKSSLLNILGLLDPPTSGELIFEDKDILNISNKQKAYIRNRELGFIFQFHHLLPEFSALENICIPAWVKQYEHKQQTKQRALELLEQVGMKKYTHSKIDTLSGGEQQRIAIARSLINSPKIILADEPTGNLDEENSRKVFNIFEKFQQEKNISFIIVTHNQLLSKKTQQRFELINKSFNPL